MTPDLLSYDELLQNSFISDFLYKSSRSLVVIMSFLFLFFFKKRFKSTVINSFEITNKFHMESFSLNSTLLNVTWIYMHYGDPDLMQHSCYWSIEDPKWRKFKLRAGVRILYNTSWHSFNKISTRYTSSWAKTNPNVQTGIMKRTCINYTCSTFNWRKFKAQQKCTKMRDHGLLVLIKHHTQVS